MSDDANTDSSTSDTHNDSHNDQDKGQNPGDTADRVVVTVRQGIAEVRFNRPDKRNALDNAQFRAIAAAGERIKREPGVRVVVVSGEGESFCAGLDFSMFANLGQTPDDGPAVSDMGDRITHLGQQVCWVWQEIEVPVIMAVHGHALGGGLQIALGGDIRIAHPATKWSVREIHWGIVPDMTGTFTLSRLVRNDIARELSLTGRIFEGREAADYGLVTRLSETPRETALELAAEMAARNPDALRGVKAMFARMYTDGAAEQFKLERDVIGSLIGTPNQVEAVAANMENRPPKFAD